MRAQVTVSVPDDMDVDVDITLDEDDTLVVSTNPDSTSVFNADFAGVLLASPLAWTPPPFCPAPDDPLHQESKHAFPGVGCLA
jgi:hypothetical protein